MLDLFNNDAFSVVSLTARINDRPYLPGQIGAAGYFEEAGVTTTTIAIEKEGKETLRLVGPTPRGGPGETRTFNEGEIRSFIIPHFEREDSLLADEVQGRRAFGGEGQEVETVLSRIDYKMRVHLQDFDATVEHQRVGAIKGIVTNKKGGVMFNLYQAFDITAPDAISMSLNDEATDLMARSRAIRYMIEDAFDAPYSGIDAWCGRNFYEKFVGHKYNRDAYKALQDRQALLGQASVDSINLFDINWNRYRTGSRATTANGGAGFIGPDECRFVLRGVPGLFITRFAPADYMETVNTEGLPRYMKQIPRRDDKGVDIQVQTNPINMCTRPDVLFSATI